MKQRFSAITQVSLAVLLALSFGFVTAGPSMAQESPEESASIYPEGEKYHLDAPEDFVRTEITWGVASKIEAVTDDDGDLTEGSGNHYIVLVNTLLILNRYLDEKFMGERKSVALNITFDDDTDATFTITAVRTHPTIDPEHAYYDVVRPAAVNTTITWRDAEKIESIKDDHDYELEENTDYTVIPIDDKTAALTIFDDPYLAGAGNLTAKGQNVTLTIQFNFGDDVTFNITAINKPLPSISPTEAKYDLDNPAPVSTTIEWGAAIKPVDAIAENDNPLTVDVDYTVEDIDDDRATLTINDSYLKDRLGDIDDNVVLTIRFDVGDPVGFTITASGTHPTIEPEDAIYDLVRPAAVNTTITWREAAEVVSIADNGYKLEADDDYSVTPVDDETATLTINDSYLGGKLEKWGDEVDLAIEFDFGSNRTFTTTAIDAHPTINPDEAEYDLNGPGDVTTDITWQHPPTQVVSIVDGDDYELEENMDYTVIPIDDKTTALTILSDPYLAGNLTAKGQSVVLTITFNVGDLEEFAITAVRYPSIDPDEAYYRWDEPPDFLKVSIAWGSDTNVGAITDNEASNLTEGDNGDYLIVGSTLLILNEYLRDKLSDLKPVTLTIQFSGGASADFTITAIGTHPTIFPSLVTYARYAPHHVATTITWGSATKVEFIVDDADNRLASSAYNVTRIYGDDGRDTGTARLTIFHHPYLEGRFEESRTTSVKLTFDFDVGDDRTFDIDTGCFIATATYGTPMAEQIQILREFRDEYLVTSSLGQGLVDTYYSISPSIADFISEHPGLKPVVRAGLVPAVAMSTAAVNTSLAEKAAIVGSLVLVSVAVGVWAARRRSRRPKCT
jgi:hypothetical protein